MKLEIKKGNVYGNFKVVNEVAKLRLPSGQTNRVFECVCICGNTKDIRLGHLVRNKIDSCGCKRRNGLSQHPLYKVWQAVLIRTSGKNNDAYTKKGIKVCEAWRKFESFYQWAINNGYKEGLQIDREDNNGNYKPSNCRFVTPITNVNNRDNTYFVVYKNTKQSFMLLVRAKGLLKNERAIRNRIKRGWSVEDAVDTPIRKGNYRRNESNI